MNVKYYYCKNTNRWCRRTKEREKIDAHPPNFPWIEEKDMIPRHLEKIAVLMLMEYPRTKRVNIEGFGMIGNSRVHKGDLVVMSLFNETWRKKE